MAENMEAVPETVEQITHAYVPKRDYAKNYVRRKVNGVEDFAMLDACMERHWNVLLMGDTGAGKTMLGMAYAAERGLQYFSVPCDVSIEPTSLFGKMMPTDTVGKFKWSDGPVTEMVRHGGVLNLSEINGMSPRISLAMFQLLDHRRSLTLLGHEGEVIEAHRDLLIIADMNPNYRGTQSLNEAFRNRFQLRVSWGYNPAAEDRLVASKALLEMVGKIRSTASISTPVGTNVMLEFQQIASRLGVKFAFENFLSLFSDTERQPVKLVLDNYETRIIEDIANINAGRSTLGDVSALPDDKGWYKADDDYSLIGV